MFRRKSHKNNPVLARASSTKNKEATLVYCKYTGSVCLGSDDMSELERFYDKGQQIELKIYREDKDTTKETIFADAIVRLKSRDDYISDGINGTISNKSIIFSIHK